MKDLVYRFLQFNMQLCLRMYAFGKKRLNIIQAGANDGREIDNMYQLIRKEKSHAIVLEPVPYIFKKLEKNYAAFPNVRPLQMAVTDMEEVSSMPFYFLQPVEGEHFLDMYNLWGSFSRAHLETFKPSVPNFDKLFSMELVPCTNINALYRQSGYKKLDILATDTEGYDGKIVNSVNFDELTPAILFFEHYHLNKQDLLALLGKLKRKGYRCYSSGYDTICVHRSQHVADIFLRLIKMIHPAWYLPVSA